MASDSKNEMGAKLLLVDDVPANLIALEAVLSKPDFQILTATSGLEALEIVEHNDFALIILDIQMPGLNGYETARRIKLLEKAKDIPIIFVTATYKDDPAIRQGYEAGAIDYFGKPFDPDILKAKVDIYANLYRRTHEVQEQKKKRIEAEARLDLELRIKTILESLNEGVLVADAEGKIVQFNDEAKQIWGDVKFVEIAHYDEYVGWNLETGERIKAEECAMAEALRNGKVTHNERVRIRCFDGNHCQDSQLQLWPARAKRNKCVLIRFLSRIGTPSILLVILTQCV